MDYAGDWATEYDYSTQEWFTGVSQHYSLPADPQLTLF